MEKAMSIEKKGDEFSIKLSALVSSIMRFLGIISLTVVDVALGGFTLSWLMKILTPESFHLMGTIVAWGISVILFTLVSMSWKWQRSIDHKVATKPEVFTSFLLPFVLNVLDSLVDATAAIIIFGQGYNLIVPGKAGLLLIVDNLPIIGWICFFIFFFISFFGELCRIALEDGKIYN